MAINNVNLAMSASSYGAYSQRLTEATAAELRRLGISFDPNNTSESQGKALIAQYKAVHSDNKNTGDNFTKNHASKTNDLFERAKKLAEKLGIAVDEKIDFKTLLSIIGQTIEAKLTISQNNISLLKELKSYSEELASIQAESIGASYDTTNKALERSLEMLSLYNKSYLNN